MTKLVSKTLICNGGLDQSTESLTLGTNLIGKAIQLQNYEPGSDGGYRRILGFDKYSNTVLPGEGPILGCKVGLGGVLAVRKTAGGDNALYFSTGGAWTGPLNGVARSGDVDKVRAILYTISDTPVITIADGVNPAAKYDGTTYTLLNGAGAPANPKYLAYHATRLFLAGYSANTKAITISAPDDDEDYSGGAGAIEVVIGDDVVGLHKFRDTLYIFCKRSIKKLTGSSSADFAISDVTGSIGCVSGDTIQEVGGDLIYLAPDGLRSLAATDRIGDVELGLVSKPIRKALADKVGTFNEDKFSSCIIRKKSQYRLFIYDTVTDISSKYGAAVYGTAVYGDRSDDNLAPGFLGKLNQEGDTPYAWATLTGINVWSCDSEYQDNDELVVFGHPSSGYVYKLESGADFDGNNIYHIYQTPHLTLDDPTIRKNLQKLTLSAKVEGNFAVAVQTVYNQGDPNIIQPPSFTIDADATLNAYGNSSSTYGTAVYSSSNDFPLFTKNILGSGNTVSFIFTGNNINLPHKIDSVQLQYGIKGRR